MRVTLEGLWTSAKSYFLSPAPGANTVASEEHTAEPEDNTVICQAIRKYYIENGRPLPDWLAAPGPAQYRATVRITNTQGLRTRRSVLSDLWDSPNTSVTQTYTGGMSSSKRYSHMLRQRHSVNVLMAPKDKMSLKIVPSYFPKADNSATDSAKSVIGADVSIPSKQSRCGGRREGSHLSSGSVRKKKQLGAEEPLSTRTSS